MDRLRKIHDRLAQARRELDALIGDAYLRSRASIVPVHFLDLSSAVEKLRWAEKEWRELEKERAESDKARRSRREEDDSRRRAGNVRADSLVEVAQGDSVPRS